MNAPPGPTPPRPLPDRLDLNPIAWAAICAVVVAIIAIACAIAVRGC